MPGFRDNFRFRLNRDEEAEQYLLHDANKKLPDYSFERQRLRQRQKALVEKKRVLESEYLMKQERNWKLRIENDRADSIENMFFREFGLVERMGEIQKCLSMKAYTGEINISILSTQLKNIERMIDELSCNSFPQYSECPGLYIPGWIAMETAAENLQNYTGHQSRPDELREALKNYVVALEVVEEAIKHVQDAFQENDITEQLTAAKARKERWEKELSDIEKLVLTPVDTMSKDELVETSQRLAEYAVERFRERL